MILAIDFDDSHIVAIDREDVIRIAGYVDQAHPIAMMQ